MPVTPRQEQQKLDPRVYFAILFFRWKLIMVCFLYCLLGGVLYLEVVPKEYLASCKVMMYRDPTLSVSNQGEMWRNMNMYNHFLTSTRMRVRVVQLLRERWAREVGSEAALWLGVNIYIDRALNMITITARSTNPHYGQAFLQTLLDEFQKEINNVKRESYSSATSVLSEELDRLSDRIRSAEEDVVEYERLHQMAYVENKASLERGYLGALMSRQQQLNSEIYMLDAQFPRLKGEDLFVIRDVNTLTRETGAVAPPNEPLTGAARDKALAEAGVRDQPARTDDLDSRLEELGRYQDLRVQLMRLQQREQELTQTLRPEHPEIQAVKSKIAEMKGQLDFSATVEFERLKSRRKALTIQSEALAQAERRWQDSYLMASRKQSDLRHLSLAVSRIESMYQNLYSRLQELKVDEELKSEHFLVAEDIGSSGRPIWPDPLKILLVTLMAGLGSGFGLALLTHVLDNKVQSITDVESLIGVPFLGGVPYWVHSGLHSRIRPIVSEEHSTGAAEAYRALRTNVISALEKAGQKVALLTSADSKEGKTLTVLNLAIMTARTGRKVLLMDADLRRGVLHKSLDRERSPGITDMLKEKRPLRDVIAKTAFDNLWFAPAGTPHKNTAELLHSADLRAFLAEAREEFDVIYMDSAPVLRITDTVILASPQLCSVIYVAHANRTPKSTIRYSIDMLEDAHVIGLIVNSIEMHRISSLYYAYQYPNYAYYSYAYAYGYDYYLHDEAGVTGRRTPRDRKWDSRRRSAMRWIRKTFLPTE